MILGGGNMFDWLLKYGENQEYEMRSGYKFATEELAKKNGEDFIETVNRRFVHYTNPKIEVIKL